MCSGACKTHRVYWDLRIIINKRAREYYSAATFILGARLWESFRKARGEIEIRGVGRRYDSREPLWKYFELFSFRVLLLWKQNKNNSDAPDTARVSDVSPGQLDVPERRNASSARFRSTWNLDGEKKDLSVENNYRKRESFVRTWKILSCRTCFVCCFN